MHFSYFGSASLINSQIWGVPGPEPIILFNFVVAGFNLRVMQNLVVILIKYHIKVKQIWKLTPNFDKIRFDE